MFNQHVVRRGDGRVGIVTLSEGGDQSLKLQRTLAKLATSQVGPIVYCCAVDATTLPPRDRYRNAWAWDGQRIVIDQARKQAIDAQAATLSFKARIEALEYRLTAARIP